MYLADTLLNVAFASSRRCSGDVYPSSGLRASVAARTYRGELIVIGESRTNPFMQVLISLIRCAGLGHEDGMMEQRGSEHVVLS